MGVTWSVSPSCYLVRRYGGSRCSADSSCDDVGPVEAGIMPFILCAIDVFAATCEKVVSKVFARMLEAIMTPSTLPEVIPSH